MSPVSQNRAGHPEPSEGQSAQLTLSISPPSDQTGVSAARSLMCGPTCHLTWITFTTSPESLPLAGWPGRTSWSPASSAVCWSGTEPSGRPAWLSATPPTVTRQSTNRQALTSSPVSDLNVCFCPWANFPRSFFMTVIYWVTGKIKNRASAWVLVQYDGNIVCIMDFKAIMRHCLQVNTPYILCRSHPPLNTLFWKDSCVYLLTLIVANTELSIENGACKLSTSFVFNVPCLKSFLSLKCVPERKWTKLKNWRIRVSGCPTGQVQVEGSPVKVQLLDTAGQVRLSVSLFFQQDIM